jgi:hypothetical protein
MGKVHEKIKTITDNQMAHAIGLDVDGGMSFDQVLEKYAKTPEMKASIKETAGKVEAALRAGTPLKEVLDTHFDNEEIKGHVHKHVAHIRASKGM